MFYAYSQLFKHRSVYWVQFEYSLVINIDNKITFLKISNQVYILFAFCLCLQIHIVHYHVIIKANFIPLRMNVPLGFK